MADRSVLNSVREVRTRRALTQERLAELTGLSRQSVISIERGRFLPTIETALRLARALDAHVEELFWLKDRSR